jgi:hypothetical protein
LKLYFVPKYVYLVRYLTAEEGGIGMINIKKNTEKLCVAHGLNGLAKGSGPKYCSQKLKTLSKLETVFCN